MVPSPYHDSDPDRAPLLGSDVEACHNPVRSVSKGGRKRLGRLPFGRWALLVIIGVAFFSLGLSMHPKTRPLSWKKNPRLAHAVRVRVLKGLLQERYPVVQNIRAIREQNFRVLDELASCLESNTCRPGQDKVVILESYHFRFAEEGGTAGEDVWARSTIRSLRALGYTLLFTSGHMDTLMIHQGIPDMVRVVLWEGSDLEHCLQRNETNYKDLEQLESYAEGDWQTGQKACMQSADFLEGIPLWKSFAFYFWIESVNPLGGQWTLSPEDYARHGVARVDNGNQYLGYSIEPRCMSEPMFTEREHRALILAKETRYFEEERNQFFGMLADARDAVPPVQDEDGRDVAFQLISTAGSEGDKVDEPGLTTMGRLPQAEWTQTLGRSKMLLGIGSPQLSPSPYDALCIGVPFINVVSSWSEDEPDNRDHWHTQQNALKYEQEPHVYHVRHHDKDGLAAALRHAAATPIGRYIPPNMRMDMVRERHRRLVETDWLAEAQKCVATDHANDPQYAYIMDLNATETAQAATAAWT